MQMTTVNPGDVVFNDKQGHNDRRNRGGAQTREDGGRPYILPLSFMEIETARLRLRPFVQDDLDALHRLWTDPEVRRYLWDDEVISKERAQVEIDRSLASFGSYGFGYWIVSHVGDGVPIGFCGIRGGGEDPEIVFGIAPGYWGQGLALEAVRAVLRYGFEQKNLPFIVGKADLPNLRSFRVMEKAGMKFQRDDRRGCAGMRHFAITREEFDHSQFA